MTTLEALRQRLEVLKPLAMEIIDDSHQHAGHAGARDGGGHYRLIITAACFAGQPTIQRHRLVYDAAGDLMKQAIHALSIVARTPEEADNPAK